MSLMNEWQMRQFVKGLGEISQDIIDTAPPDHPCGNCDDMTEQCCDFQDNRMELYRHFAFVPSDIKGEYVVVCKKCLKSVFTREGLYRRIDDYGKEKLTWLVERAKCHSCGREWRREEKPPISITIQ